MTVDWATGRYGPQPSATQPSNEHDSRSTVAFNTATSAQSQNAAENQDPADADQQIQERPTALLQPVLSRVKTTVRAFRRSLFGVFGALKNVWTCEKSEGILANTKRVYSSTIVQPTARPSGGTVYGSVREGGSSRRFPPPSNGGTHDAVGSSSAGGKRGASSLRSNGRPPRGPPSGGGGDQNANGGGDHFTNGGSYYANGRYTNGYATNLSAASSQPAGGGVPNSARSTSSVRTTPRATPRWTPRNEGDDGNRTTLREDDENRNTVGGGVAVAASEEAVLARKQYMQSSAPGAGFKQGK